MNRNRLLVTAAYAVAVSMAGYALLDTVVAMWPADAGSAAWRYSAVGMLSRHLASLLVAALLAAGVAALSGHGRMLRVIGYSLCAGAVLLLVAAAGFILDVVQLRTLIDPGARPALVLGSAAALLKLVTTAAIVLLVGFGSLKASRGDRPDGVPGRKQVAPARPGGRRPLVG
jgi:hypothetical protein